MFFIYNANEKGFWSNELGWCTRFDATAFTNEEKAMFPHLPGVGSVWMPVEEANALPLSADDPDYVEEDEE